MKIAIVTPSPVPFTIGGMENFAWGLCDSINQLTEHQAELIKIPSKEHSFWDLIDTYYKFYKMDLDHFDMIISTKYPSWMVQHKNHICYMVHCLRGFYDTWHLMGLSGKVKKGNEAIDRILNYMKKNPIPYSLDEFFAIIYDIKRMQDRIPAEYFDFPGALIRKLVIYMDNYGKSSSRIMKFYSISNTVKNRTEYFPKYTDVEVVYPPPTLKNFNNGNYKYIFMLSRLDDAKRIHLLLEAMKYVKSEIKLYIAGNGPARDKLVSLAGNDGRIVFLGFLNDDEVEGWYRDCLVVPYFPYYEDYGLITIEAMMYAKPVITTEDSGGPTEFVENNETGFIVPADPKAIADKIDYFSMHPQEAERMGKNAYDKVKEITWDSVVTQLFLKTSLKEPVMNRNKVTVTSTFPICPPQGGGQVRIFNIYKNLAKIYDVEIVSLTNEINNTLREELGSGFIENRTSKSGKHSDEEWKIERNVGVPVTDVAMPLLIEHTPEYIEKLKQSIQESEWVVISHPYMWTAAKPWLQNKRFIYEAHNVEYNMKKNMLPNNNAAAKLLSLTFEIEKECCEKSKFIMTCSEEDKVELAKLYHIPEEKCIVVPNGVDTSKTKFVGPEERLQRKQREGIGGEKIGLFMGSWHGPNLDACEEIFKIAKKCPEVKFLLVGSQCDYFKDKSVPENVGMLGVVSDEIKNRVFGLVDFALNPMLSGSGTNLKMFDYMAAGIPIITTEFGARGIDSKDIFKICDVEKMGELIQGFELSGSKELIMNSYAYVKEHFEWSHIVEKLISKIQEYNT